MRLIREKLCREIAELQKSIAAEQQRQRQEQAYQTAYETFSFVLSRSPSEARQQLERLYRWYPTQLRSDPRLQHDFQRLLATETVAFEHRLRTKLGL